MKHLAKIFIVNPKTVVIITTVILIAISLLWDTPNSKEFHSDYPRWSDGWCIDTTLYNHPDWTFLQAEDYLFMSSDDFAVKYNLKK